MKLQLLIGLVLAPALCGAQDEFMGREIARTMHWSGAEWLLRETREEEEAVSLLLDQLGVRPGMTVCDLGVGVGVHALPMALRVGPRGRVLGVDIQQEMLDMLARRAEEEGIDNVVGILAGETDPNLEPGSCDLILLVDVYHEISMPRKLLAAMRTALKPEGRVALVEFRMEDPEVPIKRLHKMSRAQILLEWESHGFALVAQFEGLPWQHLMFFERDDSPPAPPPPPAGSALAAPRFRALIDAREASLSACESWARAAARSGMDGVLLRAEGAAPALLDALERACVASGLTCALARDNVVARSPGRGLRGLLDLWQETIGSGTDLLASLGADEAGGPIEEEIASLVALREALEVIFDVDRTAGAFAHASSVWRGDPRRRASQVLDGSLDTCWAPEATDENPWLTVELGVERTFNRVVLREHVASGRRVEGCALEWRRGGVWTRLAGADAVGARRVLPTPTVTADAVRLGLLASSEPAMIAGLELHLAPPEVEILAAADSFEDELAVSMSSDAEAAIIRYTLDGSDPTAKSARYVRPLILVETTTVRAAAFLDGKRSLLPATWTATRRP